MAPQNFSDYDVITNDLPASINPAVVIDGAPVINLYNSSFPGYVYETISEAQMVKNLRNHPNGYYLMNMGLNYRYQHNKSFLDAIDAFKTRVEKSATKPVYIQMMQNPTAATYAEFDYQQFRGTDLINYTYSNNDYVIDDNTPFIRLGDYSAYMEDNVHPNVAGNTLRANELLSFFYLRN